MTGRTEATHRFLMLRQPIAESDFPCPRIFEAGRKYQFPFTFTIPTQLLPRACTHHVTSEHLRQMHLQLPPSFGEPDLSGFGATLLDDFAPEMSKIFYAIKVRIAHFRGADGMSILAEKSRKVRVKPSFEEQPPLDMNNNDEYRPQLEKSVRKRLFKGKLGTLTAKSVQPRPLVIPGARSTDNAPISTMVKIVLRFDPEDENNAPPKLSTLSTRLKAITYYASVPRRTLPSRAGLGYDLTHGVYTDNVTLGSLCVASAQWEKHDASSNPDPTKESVLRRDSGISDCSSVYESDKAFAAGIFTPSKNYKKGNFYTAQILVPITLPLNKNFIPTFHCCLISRTYTIALNLTSNGGPSMQLKVPVQICAQGSESGRENARARTAEQAAMREQAAISAGEDLLTPRSTLTSELYRVREETTNNQGEDLPPAYGAFAPPEARYRSISNEQEGIARLMTVV